MRPASQPALDRDRAVRGDQSSLDAINTTHFAKSAARALEVMELFGRLQTPLRASVIRDALSLHASSTDQLLKTLVRSGFLIFNEFTKVYHPSLRLAQFGSWMSMPSMGFHQLTELVESLCSKTQRTVTVATRCRNSMQILVHCPGIDMPTWIAEGAIFPLAGSVSGIAFLATQSDEEIGWVTRRYRLGTSEPSSGRKLIERVSCVREQGYSSGYAYGADAWALVMPLPVCYADSPLVIGFSDKPDRIRGHEHRYLDMIDREVERIIDRHPGLQKPNA